MFEQARTRLREQFRDDPPPVRFTRGVAAQQGWKAQITSLDGWQRIARNYFHTLGKIYKSALFGFFIAGAIVALVPSSFWSALFPAPTGAAGIIGNAGLGVLAGVASFIGSIGNVPFAAALWASGVSFAGVIACIYADLITVPILNLWKKFFGWKAAVYIFGVFFLTMATSAVLMEYLFSALNWIPPRLSSQSLMGFLQIKFDFTLVMAVLALIGTGALFGLARSGRS